MSVHAMADDTLALLASLDIGRADLFGYSLGAGIARKGWLMKDDVMNCLPLGKIESALAAKRRG